MRSIRFFRLLFHPPSIKRAIRVTHGTTNGYMQVLTSDMQVAIEYMRMSISCYQQFRATKENQ